jgi:cysteine-rich repeat protein
VFDPNGAIVALEVDDGTGAIAGIAQTLDLLATDERLRRPEGIALSPDAMHLYVVGRAEDAIGVFSRNPTTGVLTHVQTLQQDVDDVDGLKDVNTVAVSADGGQVYTSLSSSDFLGVFDRDPGTGELTFVEILKGGVLKDVFDIDSSPDGRHVYIGDRGLPGVSAFLRLPSGRLGFLGQHIDGKNGEGGLTDTVATAVSADGRNLYSVSMGDPDAEFAGRDVSLGALVTFVRDQCGSTLVTGGEQCDDGNVAGADGCDAECALELCGPAPAGGCRTPVVPGGAQLKIKKKDLLVWKWGKGAATDVPDFGDPLTAASYLLCLYDSSGGTQPLRAFAAPAGGSCLGRPCWAVTGTSGFKYLDKQRTPDGLLKTQLKAGIAGKAKANVKGKGALLALPALPLVPPVTAQLVNDDTGVCWSATFSTPLSNTADQFKAKSD